MTNNTPISSLPIAVSLSGSEAVVMDQAGTTKTGTVSLINSVNPANLPTGGILGQALVKTSSANYASAWQSLSGIGTVTNISSGTGITLSPSPITASGSVSLASISTGNVLANTTGSTAAPVPTTPSSVLDVIGSTQGDILFRSASGWNVLAPGTNGQILTTGGAAANPSWSAAGSGSVSSVGLALPSSILTVSGSPVTTTGTLTGTLATQAANEVWAGPTTGSAATPTFRALVGADLPNPSASSLGGVQSAAAISHQWINSISTSGVPALSQPAFTDISGTVAAAQLPNPTVSTLGGVQSFAAVSNQFLTQISTSGVVSATQPSFGNLSGNATLSQLPSIGNNTVLSNISGGSSTPLANGLSAVIDSAIGSTQGDVLYRGASTWSVLAPGTNGQVLTTGGASANPAWSTVTGTGTVTSVATNNGITGGTITTTGTIGLATITTGNVLANTTGSTAVPVATAPTAILDVIGSTEGNILYRGASTWSVLAPGTNGQFLQTPGAGSTPSWASAVTSIVAGKGLSGGTITSTGTISANAAYSRSYIAGLNLSTAGSSATFGIAAGVANDSANALMMQFPSAYTKTTSSWAVGSGNGALDTGSISNSTWYHAFLIERTDTSVVDVLISLSASSPTLPSNYTLFRRIGSMKTNGSAQWTAFSQLGDEFLWLASVLDVNNATLTAGTPVLETLTVPPGVQVTARIDAAINSASAIGVLINSPDQNAVSTPSFPNFNVTNMVAGGAGAMELMIRTSTSQQVRVAVNSTSAGFYITTQGWNDSRGKYT